MKLMFDITFLGTSASVPSAGRCTVFHLPYRSGKSLQCAPDRNTHKHLSTNRLQKACKIDKSVVANLVSHSVHRVLARVPGEHLPNLWWDGHCSIHRRVMRRNNRLFERWPGQQTRLQLVYGVSDILSRLLDRVGGILSGLFSLLSDVART